MAPRDNPDPAEAGAYFPSQASLRRAPRTTDYDGPAHPAPDGPTRGRILMIATEERYLPIRGGILFSTGNHPVETLVPLLHLEAAGFDTDVATLSGAMAKFEHWAFPHDDEAVRGIYERMLPRFRGPQRLRDVLDRGLDGYDAVYLPGGHGAMNGLPRSHDVRDVLRRVQERDMTMIAICHGPAALVAGGLDGGTNPFTGYEVVAYPDRVDAGPSIESGYLPGEMEWYVGEALVAQGLDVLNRDDVVSGRVHRDRNLLSGDSPQAANALGRLATEFLASRA
ncbi:DJ-1/PfpI family protein [Pseudonocardia sp. ICBG1034]|uniref:DJ-1/PfpI family protein n=1 Tax=Pseudonocardia sp. ICBG1034 TaxID=2844381 RepID=UPI001CCEABE3|nr:DJ-1/PfpI family protein [Pseudonocardia sp. ICBG1034]